MIHLSTDSKAALTISQTNERPSVYCDHWALMSLAADERLAHRFNNALETRHGTLALSWLNLVEFAQTTDQQQIEAVENFVEAIIPRIFFIAIDPSPVIRSEDEVIQRRRVYSDWGDLSLLKAFVMRKTLHTIHSFTAKGLFSNLRDPKLIQKLGNLGDIFISRIEALRRQYANDAVFAKAVQKPPRGSALLPATRFLIPELLGFLVKSKGTKLTRNGAADFLHAIVPLAYCDYVLLDGHWATQATIAAQRLSKTGQVTGVARVFSGRKGGLRQFLHEFESETSGSGSNAS